jgi:beta-lactamase regulating signal transducer with metallopeptidase domain
MNRLFFLYLAGLVLRSFILGAFAAIILLMTRRVEIRHAVWTIVLMLIVLMPIADAGLPRVFVQAPLHDIVVPIQMFIVGPQTTAQPAAASLSSELPGVIDWWRVPVVLVGFGTFLFLTRFIFMMRKVRWIRRASRPIENALWNEWRQRDRRKAVLSHSDLVRVPLTIGFGKPVVILPSGWHTWEESTLRHVLVHEWTHITRHDWAIASFAAFVKSVFWFNPLVWWIERKLSSLSEQASDEASVRFSGDPQGYAETLLQFATAACQGDRWIGGVTMAQHKISQRIERILTLQRPGGGVLSRTAWATLVTLSLPVLYLSASPQAKPVEVPSIRVMPIQAPMDIPIAASPIAVPPQNLTPRQPTLNAPELQTLEVQAPVVAPQIDLVGEIKLILAPVDQPIVPGQVQLQTRDGRFSANSLTWNPNNDAFGFALKGVEDRTLKFEGAHGDSFSYRCPDCSFLVWESGVGSPAASQAPGIVFQLSSDERTLTATCRAAECLAVGTSDDVRRTVNGATISIIAGSIVAARFSRSETLTFPVSRENGGGIVSCFNFGKPDGTPFNDANCPTNHVSVGPATSISFSVKR